MRILCLTFILVLSAILSTQAVTYYTHINGGTSGNWNAASTWTTDPSGLSLVGSAVPANSDVVVILNGYTVTLTANVTTTGHSIIINSGGTLDLSTFTITTITSLSGSGTLRIGAGYFPTVTTNTFATNTVATVEYYDFTGNVPNGINYPNVLFSNSTTTDHNIRIANAANYTMTVNGNFTTSATGTGSLTVTFGTQATRTINATINRNITIGSNTTLIAGSFNATHNLTVLGNMTNNGTVDFSNAAQYNTSNVGAINLTFTGATDNTLACNGITDLYTLTVNKGTGSTNILSVTSTNVNNFRLFFSGVLINLTNGTLRLGANIDIPRIQSGTGNYDVGSTSNSPMFWVDGANVTFVNHALVVYGKFRITAGSFTVLGGEGSVIREEGQYIIEGGTFTTEKFRPSLTADTHRGSFLMSGGTLNAQGTGSSSAYARFSHPYPEQVFIMTGGVINVSNHETGIGGGIHIGCKASNYTVTGGTFNAILTNASGFFGISSTVPFWNLNISRTGTATTARLQGIGSVTGSVTTPQPLVVLNNLTIDGTNPTTFNANGLQVTVGGDFTINNGGTYTPSGNITTFNGSADQSFSNSGTITTGLFRMEVNKTSGTLTLGGAATSFTVTNSLNILDGVLNDGGKTLFVTGSINNNAFHTGTGSITLDGSATQTITGDGTGVFGNVVLSNTSNPGVQINSDITISGLLTLTGTTNSIFDIGVYRLSFSSSSATSVTTTGNGYSSTKMIRTAGFQSDGGVRKTFSTVSAFTFPFGSGTTYTPVTIQFNSAPTAFGNITARPVNARHPLVTAGNTNNLTWYWKITSIGFTGVPSNGVSMIFQYSDNNVSPANDDATYLPARYNPTAWTVINDVTQVNETTNQIFFSNVGYIDGEFTAGVPSAFGVVRIFYSKRNGNWNDVNPGTTPWSTVSHTGADANVFPTAGDQVYIGDGVANNHTINITTNNQSSGGLEINAGSVLDVGITTGHNFGAFDNQKITGSGTMRISSAVATAQFPAGDFGNFIRASGGTVEYYSTGTQDFTIPLVSANPTLLPLTTYRHLIITPNAGRFITLPNQNMTIYGNMTVQGTAASGVARLNSTTSRTLIIEGNLNITSGTLQFRNVTPQQLEILGNITIGSTGTFDLASTGAAATNTILLYGSIVNNGILDFHNTASYLTNITFTDASNTSVTGTGSTTDFSRITVSKGATQAPILEVNASAFSLSGISPTLTLQTGTFRLTSPQTINISDAADFDIPAAARLSANGGTIQITGSDGIDLTLAGTLEVLAGQVDVGTTANDNSIEYAATGSPTISVSGGILNVQGQIRRSAASSQGSLIYNQSGSSTVRVAIASAATLTRSIFEIINSGSQFNMSGGTLQISRAFASGSQTEVFIQPTSSTVTGGTLEIGTGNSSQIIRINTTVPLHSLTVTGTTNTATLNSNPLTLRGSLEIQAGCVFNANNLNVSVAQNFTNLNTTSTTGLNAGGYRPGVATQTTTLNGSANNQLVTGTSGNNTVFGNLVINNTFTGGTVTLQSSTNLRVAGTLTLTAGVLAATTNTISVLGTVSNSSTHTTTSGVLNLNGTSNQFITGNGNGVFGNVTLNNSSGATFGANQEITGTLNLNNGSLNIGSFALVLSSTSFTSITNATSARYIITNGNLSDGGITKSFPASASGTFTYPIGVSGKYTPATFTITTGVSSGSVTIKPVNTNHPNATGSGTAFINYYWSVTNNGTSIGTLTHTYTYVAADQSGNILDYRDARFQGGAWTVGVTAGNPNTATRVITFTNTTITGDYTAGEATAFVDPTTYTSIASGSWDSDLSVWDIDPPGTNLGPPVGSFVIISEGTTVTIPTNGKRTATLEVRGRLHVGTTTGHDFGVVSTGGTGERTLQLQSGTFPSGNFTAFVATGTGTVEYNGTMTLPTQSAYNNLSFSGAGTKTLANTNLTINGNLTITAGTVSASANNPVISLVNTTGDFTNNGTFNAGTGRISVGRNLTNSGASASFSAGNGADGLIVGGNLVNSTNATFTVGTDSIGVRGSLLNSATFSAGAGIIRISNALSNTSGTFNHSSGLLQIRGAFTNNALYNAGTGTTTVQGTFTNSGAGAIYNGNTNNTSLNGAFTNISGATFNASAGTYSVNGNWTNTANFNAQLSTVNFASSGAQNLTGTTTFYNLSRTNGGALTLNDAITVSNLLTMTGGNIITGSNNLNLTNTTAQPVTGFSASSFIDGRVVVSFPNGANTTRIYPVGRNTTYRPVTLRQTALSASPVVQVEMINTPPTGSYPTGVGILSEARYFAVNLISGTISFPTVELSFNTNGTADEDITIPGNTRVMRATTATGPWTDEGGNGVFSPAAPAGYATSGITTISNPTFFALAYPNAALPVTLGSFTGQLLNSAVNLEWKTFTEKDNAYFTIERSSGELSFDSIAVIEGAGNSSTVRAYQYIDTNPFIGRSYYRLKQTDFDGKFSYSHIVVIDNNGTGSPMLSVWPNPSHFDENLTIGLYNIKNKETRVAVCDATGKVLTESSLNFAQPIRMAEVVKGKTLSSGVYVIKVYADARMLIYKFVIL